MDQYRMRTPLGILQIEGDSQGLSAVFFNEADEEPSQHIPNSLSQAVLQLHEYFNKHRVSFNLSLQPIGTEFQKKVWAHLQTIPFGRTASYQQIANELGDPNVIRAAATANGKNPLAIIIPCHRVIGTDGSLTGYAGGLHRKKWLLAHESPVKQGELF